MQSVSPGGGLTNAIGTCDGHGLPRHLFLSIWIETLSHSLSERDIGTRPDTMVEFEFVGTYVYLARAGRRHGGCTHDLAQRNATQRNARTQRTMVIMQAQPH